MSAIVFGSPEAREILRSNRVLAAKSCKCGRLLVAANCATCKGKGYDPECKTFEEIEGADDCTTCSGSGVFWICPSGIIGHEKLNGHDYHARISAARKALP